MGHVSLLSWGSGLPPRPGLPSKQCSVPWGAESGSRHPNPLRESLAVLRVLGHDESTCHPQSINWHIFHNHPISTSRPNTANRSQHHLQVSHPPCFCLSICQHRVTWHRNTPKMAGGPSRVGRVRGSIGHLFAEALCEVHDPFLETSDIVGWETPSTVTHYTVARNGIKIAVGMVHIISKSCLIISSIPSLQFFHKHIEATEPQISPRICCALLLAQILTNLHILGPLGEVIVQGGPNPCWLILQIWSA